MIAGYLGAFLITFLLTRITNRVFGRTLGAIKSASISFTLIAILALAVSSQTMGITAGFYKYIPCLVLILAMDIYRAKLRSARDSNV